MSDAQKTKPDTTHTVELADVLQTAETAPVNYEPEASALQYGLAVKRVADADPTVLFFSHPRSYTMPDTLRDKIQAYIPGATFIDVGAIQKRLDNADITRDFKNPEYTSEKALDSLKVATAAKVCDAPHIQAALAPAEPISKTPEIPTKAPGRLSLFSRKDKAQNDIAQTITVTKGLGGGK